MEDSLFDPLGQWRHNVDKDNSVLVLSFLRLLLRYRRFLLPPRSNIRPSHRVYFPELDGCPVPCQQWQIFRIRHKEQLQRQHTLNCWRNSIFVWLKISAYLCLKQ